MSKLKFKLQSKKTKLSGETEYALQIFHGEGEDKNGIQISITTTRDDIKTEQDVVDYLSTLGYTEERYIELIEIANS